VAEKKNSNRRSGRKRKNSGFVGGIAAFTGGGADAAPDVEFAQIASAGTAKLLVGILLLPLCWVSLESFLLLFRDQTIANSYWRSTEFISFGMGSVFWLILFFSVRSRWMMWFYVAGHEITHAIFALICLGKISQLHISSAGGHILTNRNNFLISLSPYFFPFYTVMVIGIWALLDWAFFDFGRAEINWLYGLIGFTWMFHLTFTIWMIRRDQPDLKQNGRVFSFAINFLANMLIISALLIMASPTATFLDFGHSFVANVESFPGRLLDSIRELGTLFLDFFPL